MMFGNTTSNNATCSRQGLALYIRLSGLFHDIAKPHTREWSKEKNKYNFYGHDVVGAKLTKKKNNGEA